MPYVNLVITFALAGLWHGASWTFVLWGLLHGAGQAAHRAFTAVWPNPKNTPRWRVIAGTFITFHFVAAAWIFFRCDSMAQAAELLGRLGEFSIGTGNISLPVVAATSAAILLQFAPVDWLTILRVRFVALPAMAQGLLLACVAMLVRWISGAQISPFIYQRF